MNLQYFSRIFFYLFIGTAFSLQSWAQSHPRQPIQLMSPLAPGSFGCRSEVDEPRGRPSPPARSAKTYSEAVQALSLAN